MYCVTVLKMYVHQRGCKHVCACHKQKGTKMKKMENIISRGVLSIRALCLCPFGISFPELNSPFQMGRSTKCALLTRCSAAACPSDRPQSIWNPSCTQYPLESTSGPAIRRKPLRHRTLQLCSSRQRTRPHEERLEFSRRLGQDARPSSDWLEILCSHPIAASIWSNRPIAERCRPPQRGRAKNFWKAHRHVRDERPHRADKPTSLFTECCNEVWFVPQIFVLRRQLWEEQQCGRGLEGRTRCNTD